MEEAPANEESRAVAGRAPEFFVAASSLAALVAYGALVARGDWRAGAAGLLLHGACVVLALLPLARLAIGRRHPTAPLAGRLNAAASALAFLLVALQTPGLAPITVPAGLGLVAAELRSARAPASGGIAPSLAIGAGWLALAGYAYAEPRVYPFASGFALVGLLLAAAAWRGKRRALFAAVVALFAVGSCELGCQVSGALAGRSLEARRRYFFELHQPDEALGYRPRANLRGFVLTHHLDPELRVSLDTDSRGFRNPGRDYERAQSWFLGDSFTWGSFVARDETFVGRLEERWQQPAISLGVNGYGFPHYERLFELVEAARPRRAYLCVFANDLAYVGERLTSRGYAPKQARARFVRKASIFYWSDQVVRRLVAQARKRLPRKAPSGLTLWPVGGAAPDYLASRHNERVEACLRRIVARAKAAKVELRVLLLPSKERVYREDYERLFPHMRGYLENEAGGYERLSELAAELGVPCLDLTPALRERALSGGEPLYFALDPHWTPAGHRAAAEAIAGW